MKQKLMSIIWMIRQRHRADASTGLDVDQSEYLTKLLG